MTKYLQMMINSQGIDFSEWLLTQLRLQGISQADLSRLTGLSKQAISSYINRKRVAPDPDALVAIARALGFRPEVVFEAAGILPGGQVDPEMQRIANMLSELPEPIRTVFSQAIEDQYNRLENERSRKTTEPRTRPRSGGTGPLTDPSKI